MRFILFVWNMHIFKMKLVGNMHSRLVRLIGYDTIDYLYPVIVPALWLIDLGHYGK